MGVFVPELLGGGSKRVSPRVRFRQNFRIFVSEDWPRVCVVLAVYVIGGAVVTWLIGQDSVTSRQAFTYGLGWPTLIKGLGEGLAAGATMMRRR
jgi:hypothetical protein